MDDIRVGDWRRFIGSKDEHEVTAVISWGVEYDPGVGRLAAAHRPEYDNATEPVPAAPTFERGDVVLWEDRAGVVTEILEGSYIKFRCQDDVWVERREDLTPTGHKVATINEGQRFVIRGVGSVIPTAGRQYAEHQVEQFPDIVGIATVRDGRLVTPVTVDGVEHLVPVLSEARS